MRGSVASFVRQGAPLPWLFRGPTGICASVFVLSTKNNSRGSVAKFGIGWRNFWEAHGLIPGDRVILKFSNAQIRICDVDISLRGLH